MERKYTDTVKIDLWNNHRTTKRKTYTTTRLRKGLKLVHIGEDVWLCGKISMVKDPKDNTKMVKHQVIYGPNRKEYHIYGNDVNFVCSEIYKDSDHSFYEYHGTNGEKSFINRHGNYAIEASLKIYILTHILDSSDNWCFNLKNIPTNGPLKVIYHNGTIKNIDFVDKFENIEIRKGKYLFKSIIKPVAYRVN